MDKFKNIFFKKNPVCYKNINNIGNIECNKTDFTWFSREDIDECSGDTIGISNDFKYISSTDNIIYEMTYFSKYLKYEKSKIIKYIVYKINNMLNLMYHEKYTLIVFRFVDDKIDSIKFKNYNYK